MCWTSLEDAFLFFATVGKNSISPVRDLYVGHENRSVALPRAGVPLLSIPPKGCLGVYRSPWKVLQSEFLLRLLRNHNNNKVETPHTTTESSGGKGLFCRYKLVSILFSYGNDGGTFKTLSWVLSHFVVGRVSRVLGGCNLHPFLSN